jgi:hypothetical protein
MGVPMGRLTRQRHEAESTRLDLISRETSPTTRILVQVYDGGLLPTGMDKYYLTHPVIQGGNECEGCPSVATVDTSTTIPVVIVGGVPATAGDILVAHSVGGRWVGMLTGGAGSSEDVEDCGTFTVPRSDLTITFSGGQIYTLTWSPVSAQYYCFGFGGLFEDCLTYSSRGWYYPVDPLPPAVPIIIGFSCSFGLELLYAGFDASRRTRRCNPSPSYIGADPFHWEYTRLDRCTFWNSPFFGDSCTIDE